MRVTAITHTDVSVALRVARLGLEPRTDGLKVRCSTIELTRRRGGQAGTSVEAYRLDGQSA
jgi:hypothetical protein